MEELSLLNQGCVPSVRFMKRRDKNMYALIHFGLNTFTDKEWGYGDENPEIFNPSEFDAGQIVKACKDGGMTGVILVCKHHDGFCLWPTKSTEYNITKSPWRNGKGDMVGEIVAASRKQGLDCGFYVSPWDRNSRHYGTPEYLKIYRQQLREVLTNYGPAFEVWFDGANGGDGYYGGAREARTIDHTTYYDWPNTWKMVRELQPDALIFSDIGPDLRWVGNELGFAGDDSRGSITPRPPEGIASGRYAPGYCFYQENPVGQTDGSFFIPPECDVPLRPGWFYHSSEDDCVRPLPLLTDIYFKSVGRGGMLNLGIAPDRRGLVHENDVKRLSEFSQAVGRIFSNMVGESDGGEIMLGCGMFNIIELCEDISKGEQITSFAIEVKINGAWKTIHQAKSVGTRRLIRLDGKVKADAVRARILGSLVSARIEKMALYDAPSELLETSCASLRSFDPGVYSELKACTAGGAGVLCFIPEKKISSFVYCPLSGNTENTVYKYRLELDGDVIEGEFSNILANPIPQEVRFSPRFVREIRFSGFIHGRKVEDIRFEKILVKSAEK